MPIDTNPSITDIVREYSRPDVHIGAGEDESPWVPFVENVYIRHLAFDVRGSSFANILWVKEEWKTRAPSPSRSCVRMHAGGQLAIPGI